MEVVVLIVSIFALFLQLGVLVWLWDLARDIRHPGIGRIVFLALTTFKVWALFVILYFLINSFVPSLLGPLDSPYRLIIRLLLAVYLVLHPAGVLIALFRWRYRRY